MNTVLKKNAEGYTDPTASAILTQPEPGDVYNYNAGECLILASHKDIFTALRLKDGEFDGNVKIDLSTNDTRTVTTVNPNYIFTVSRRNLYDYVESVSVEDFNRVIQAVQTGLNFKPLRKEDTEVVDPADTDTEATLRFCLAAATEARLRAEDNLCSANKTIHDLKEEYEAIRIELDTARVELTTANQYRARCACEIDILRDLYDDLLTRFIKKGD